MPATHWTRVRNPDTGAKFWVPTARVDRWLERGLHRARGKSVEVWSANAPDPTYPTEFPAAQPDATSEPAMTGTAEEN